MKKGVEITMEELHIGTCKTVVSMQIGDSTELQEFLDSMIKSNPAAMRSLQSAMATISSEENYVNNRKYNSVSEAGIYEIKTGGIRLYCFQDRLNDDPPCLIIATNGGNKNTKKEQNRDIKRAAKIQAEYHLAKESDKTTLIYNEQDDEN
jgi:hypothetical protein